MKRCTIAGRIGYNIRWERNIAGLSQRDLAERIGIGQGNMSRIENGKVVPSAVQLVLIGRECGVSPGALLAHA